jgi:DNA-binding transcriptional MerR regulator
MRSAEREISYLHSGQVAEILGVTKKTLKNWLRCGLIPEPERDPMNLYRLWKLQDIEVIRRVLEERKKKR